MHDDFTVGKDGVVLFSLNLWETVTCSEHKSTLVFKKVQLSVEVLLF